MIRECVAEDRLVWEIPSDVLTFEIDLQCCILRNGDRASAGVQHSVFHHEEQSNANGKTAFTQCQQIKRAVVQSFRRKMEFNRGGRT